MGSKNAWRSREGKNKNSALLYPPSLAREETPTTNINIRMKASQSMDCLDHNIAAAIFGVRRAKGFLISFNPYEFLCALFDTIIDFSRQTIEII